MNQIKYHVISFLRAISETFFFDNAYFGAGILFLFLLFDRDFFLFGLIAALIGYLYSINYHTPKILKDFGLITINGFFFGIAMASLFQKTPVFYFCLMVGAFGIPLVTKAVFEVVQHWKLSPFVVPYILVVWVIWLSGHGAALELKPERWPDTISYLPSLHPGWFTPIRMVIAVFQSMGRLLFLPNPMFGAGILVLVTVFSPRRGAYFLLGTVVATLVAYVMSAGSASWEYGYFSFSAGLIGLGLASFPEKFTFKTILLFCMLSSILTMAIDQFLNGLHLPTLSVPYVVTLWIAFLSRVPQLSVSWAPARSLVGGPQLLQGPEGGATQSGQSRSWGR